MQCEISGVLVFKVEKFQYGIVTELALSLKKPHTWTPVDFVSWNICSN